MSNPNKRWLRVSISQDDSTDHDIVFFDKVTLNYSRTVALALVIISTIALSMVFAKDQFAAQSVMAVGGMGVVCFMQICWTRFAAALRAGASATIGMRDEINRNGFVLHTLAALLKEFEDEDADINIRRVHAHLTVLRNFIEEEKLHIHTPAVQHMHDAVNDIVHKIAQSVEDDEVPSVIVYELRTAAKAIKKHYCDCKED